MSSYVASAASATIGTATSIATATVSATIESTRQGVSAVRKTYRLLTQGGNSAKQIISGGVNYLADGGVSEITINTILAAQIAPKIIQLAKTPQTEATVARLLEILKKILLILQSEELQKFTQAGFDLIRSRGCVELINESTNLPLDIMKLLQTKETEALKDQIETVFASLASDAIKRTKRKERALKKTRKGMKNSHDEHVNEDEDDEVNNVWRSILRYIEELMKKNLITRTEAVKLRKLARKQNHELWMLFDAYADINEFYEHESNNLHDFTNNLNNDNSHSNNNNNNNNNNNTNEEEEGAFVSTESNDTPVDPSNPNNPNNAGVNVAFPSALLFVETVREMLEDMNL